jgi:hypothetical protein
MEPRPRWALRVPASEDVFRRSVDEGRRTNLYMRRRRSGAILPTDTRKKWPRRKPVDVEPLETMMTVHVTWPNRTRGGRRHRRVLTRTCCDRRGNGRLHVRAMTPKNRRLPRIRKARLEEMIEQATVDAYNESEQITGFPDSRSSRPICAGGSRRLIGARAAPPKRRKRRPTLVAPIKSAGSA